MKSDFSINLLMIEQFFLNKDITTMPVWTDLWNVSEQNREQASRLFHNRILGIFLSKMELREGSNSPKIQDKNSEIYFQDLLSFYNQFYSPASRETLTKYLLQLVAEGVLTKSRIGKQVKYQLAHDPSGLSKFWLVQDFCILYSYLIRVNHLIKKINAANSRESKRFLEFTVIIAIKNRLEACSSCPFADKEKYLNLSQQFDKLIEKKSLALNALKLTLMQNLGEITVFGGNNISMINRSCEKIDIIIKLKELIEIWLYFLKYHGFVRDLPYLIVFWNSIRFLIERAYEEKYPEDEF